MRSGTVPFGFDPPPPGAELGSRSARERELTRQRALRRERLQPRQDYGHADDGSLAEVPEAGITTGEAGERKQKARNVQDKSAFIKTGPRDDSEGMAHRSSPGAGVYIMGRWVATPEPVAPLPLPPRLESPVLTAQSPSRSFSPANTDHRGQSPLPLRSNATVRSPRWGDPTDCWAADTPRNGLGSGTPRTGGTPRSARSAYCYGMSNDWARAFCRWVCSAAYRWPLPPMSYGVEREHGSVWVCE